MTLTAEPSAAAVDPDVVAALADPLLAFLADGLTDLESTRIAAENRLRQLTRDEPDEDGEVRGFGLPIDHPVAVAQAATVEALAAAEHSAVKQLEKRLRAHPLGTWVRAQKGIGDRQAARLLATIGDPAWHSLDGRPRLLSELWSYSGYGRIEQVGGSGVALRRARGEQTSWNPDAKMRAYLVAVSIVKTSGPWRDVYDTARAKYADAVHPTACVRCGPAGKPAAPGSPLSPGHQHARALRAVAKEVLRGLWLEARRLHGELDSR